MLATALFKRGTGSNGSPEQKKCLCVFLLFILLHFILFLFCSFFVQPFSFSITSWRWRLSSQMLCSMELLARPKVRNVAMAKRRCLLHTSPLLKKRPAETEKPRNITQVGIRRQVDYFNTDLLYVCVIHLSSLNKFWSPSGYKAGPQSCQPASLWLLSPSSTQTQTLFCVFPDVCRTHSHKHPLAVDAGIENKWPVVQHVTLIRCTFLWHCDLISAGF